MDEKLRARLGWVELFLATRNSGYVCRRCGISRPTLRKWVRRYESDGIDGLQEKSRRPQTSPNIKVTPEIEAQITALRSDRKLGCKRIASEMLRLHDVSVSAPTVQKILNRNGMRELPNRVRKRKYPKRYNRPIPGDRVQMDVCKIAPGFYHYAAIDDCSRYKVVGLYPRRTAANTTEFLERVVEEMPFPIQRLQTDRGREFFAYKVQEWLQDYRIKFRPIRPRSPHLNGKIERSHKTDLQEFYAIQSLHDPELEMRLFEWQHFYNWHRPHSSLGGKTPMEKCHEVSQKTPYWDEVIQDYDINNEPIREQNFQLDLAMKKLK